MDDIKTQRFKDIVHPNNWKIPKIDPNDKMVELGQYIAGEKNMGSPLSMEESKKQWENYKRRLGLEQAYLKGHISEESLRANLNPDPVSANNAPTELQPGDVLTDKEGREWEVSDLSEDPESIGWLYLKPKPKQLSGFVNVYSDGWYGQVDKDRDSADKSAKEVWGNTKTKRIACIDLSQFEEGYGLQNDNGYYCFIVVNPGANCVGCMDYVGMDYEWWVPSPVEIPPPPPPDDDGDDEEYETPLKMML